MSAAPTALICAFLGSPAREAGCKPSAEVANDAGRVQDPYEYWPGASFAPLLAVRPVFDLNRVESTRESGGEAAARDQGRGRRRLVRLYWCACCALPVRRLPLKSAAANSSAKALSDSIKVT